MRAGGAEGGRILVPAPWLSRAAIEIVADAECSLALPLGFVLWKNRRKRFVHRVDALWNARDFSRWRMNVFPAANWSFW